MHRDHRVGLSRTNAIGRRIGGVFSERNPMVSRTKERCRYQTQRLLALGVLDKGPCATCGAADNIHVHHPDYSKPYLIICLCSRCHKAHHNATRKPNIEAVFVNRQGQTIVDRFKSRASMHAQWRKGMKLVSYKTIEV